MHSHNIELDHSTGEYEFATQVPPTAAPEATDWTFQGYRRANGQAGTRNYIAVISNVNCSASVSRFIARHFTSDRLRDYPHVDGVVALAHHSGCAMQFGGQQHQILNRVMGGIARHPNVGGYLLVGLGCENVTLDYLIRDQQLVQIDSAGGSPTDSSGPDHPRQRRHLPDGGAGNRQPRPTIASGE